MRTNVSTVQQGRMVMIDLMVAVPVYDDPQIGANYTIYVVCRYKMG